jgi:hypothetical protein
MAVILGCQAVRAFPFNEAWWPKARNPLRERNKVDATSGPRPLTKLAFMRSLRILLAYFVLFGWGLICLFPLYWMGIGSMKSTEDVANGPAYVPFIDFVPFLTLGDISCSLPATIRWDVSLIRRSYLRVQLQLQSSSEDSRLSVSCELNAERGRRLQPIR